MFKVSQRRKGFTLIELLIVIVVIAILALIVIPRLMNASRKAKESALVANLQQIRGAVEAFHAESNYYPKTLVVLTQTTFAAGDMVDSAGADAPSTFPVSTLSGPYLKVDGTASGIPNNPFAAATQAITDQWSYTNTSGTVKPGLAANVSYPATTLLDGKTITSL